MKIANLDQEWTDIMLDYLAHRYPQADESRLDRAVEHAPSSGVAEFLLEFQRLVPRDISDIENSNDNAANAFSKVALRLYSAFNQDGNVKAAHVIRLIHLDLLSLLPYGYLNLPAEQQHLAKAHGLKRCDQSISLARKINHRACIAFFLYLKGKFSYEMRDLAQARKASLEARDNYRELCVTDRERYTPYLALAELNLARIYREERSYGFAIDCGLAARDRLRPIASRSAQLTSMLALTLRTLASIYRETGKVQVAEENCIEALSIFRTLRRQHHQFHSEYSAEIAITEGTWAGLLRRRGHLSDARKKCIHALERWQSLPAQLRARLVLDEVMLLYTVGDVETQLKQWKHATAHYRKAISICKKHCHRQTKVFEPYLAASLRNLGIILRDTSNEVEARSAFAEASRLFARHDLLLDNAVTCYEWGFLERYGRSSYKARVLFEKCVRNCEMELQKFQPEESDYHHLFKGRVENAYQWLIDYYADSIYKTSD